MQMKQSKTWDMQLHWLRDKQNTNHFKVFWDKGSNQGADYWTKHHPTVYHRHVRQARKIVRDMHSSFTGKVSMIFQENSFPRLTSLQGCVDQSH